VKSKRWPPKGYPLVEGRYSLTADWSVELPSQFARRIENGSLVLWRPKLTIWLDAWGNDHATSRTVRRDEIKSKIAATATAVRESANATLSRLAYRLRDTNDDGVVEALHTFVFSDAGHLQMAVYFEELADEAVAIAIADSVALVR
jgi:hypothetical protein